MILPGPVRTILSVPPGGVSPVFIFLSIMPGFWFGLTPGWSGLHTVLVILMWHGHPGREQGLEAPATE